MWASEMLAHCGIDSWTTNSHVVHAQCDLTAAGVDGDVSKCAFQKTGEVWPAFAHEPNVARAPTGEWVMYFTSSANRSAAKRVTSRAAASGLFSASTANMPNDAARRLGELRPMPIRQ